jgi:hypothetical protein
MSLPTSGEMSFSDINTELERSSDDEFSLDDITLRAWVDILSGDISISDLHGLDVDWKYDSSQAFWYVPGSTTYVIYYGANLNFSTSSYPYYYDGISYRFIKGPHVTGDYYKVGRIPI